MTKADDIQDRMRVICDHIQDAIAKVDSGAMVNLAGLDKEVGQLCDRTLALPAAQAMQVQPQMAEMIGYLDRLGSALRDFQDRTRSGKTGQ